LPTTMRERKEILWPSVVIFDVATHPMAYLVQFPSKPILILVGLLHVATNEALLKANAGLGLPPCKSPSGTT